MLNHNNLNLITDMGINIIYRLCCAVSYSDEIWPWSGWLAVHIVVRQEAQQFEGIAQGRFVYKYMYLCTYLF